MKTLSLLLVLLAIYSCSNPETPSDQKPEKLKNSFEMSFAHADTTTAGESMACSNGIYKRISDKYVIHFTSEFPVQFDSCYTVDFKGLYRKLKAELFVFEKGEASLTNICTDILLSDAPKPSKTLYSESGKVVFGYSNPTTLYGNQTQCSSVWIRELIFVDTESGEKIKISNELLWKVLDLGTPG